MTAPLVMSMVKLFEDTQVSIFTFRARGQGNRIGPVFLSVCLSVSAVMGEPFDLFMDNRGNIIGLVCLLCICVCVSQSIVTKALLGKRTFH